MDETGRPLHLEISAGNLHDSEMTDAFLDWHNELLAIVADKAYGRGKIRQQIADEGALALIPSKSNAKTGLVKHISQHDLKLISKILYVETVDYPSDGQIVAYALKFFRSADSMRPQ